MNKQINIIIVSLAGLLIFQNCVTDNAIKVMSFNIRYNNPDDGEFACPPIGVAPSWRSGKKILTRLVKLLLK